jgi:hypothetical protein
MPVNLHPREERGFSMFIVVTAMLVTAMFVAAAFAAADGGLNMSVENKQRKASYAAAEAGLGFYMKRLRENPDVWAQCEQASAPNTTEKSPINQQWDGEGKDPRTWRKIPGVPAEYTVELLHTSKSNKCDVANSESMVDMSDGTFKVRVTGRATEDRSAKRSVIVTLRKKNFLEFVYFTDQENRDPQAATTATERNSQQANCVNRKRSQRAGRGCVEIQFANGDSINGPLHTNDEDLLICGSPVFGRDKDGEPGTDSIEVFGVDPGYRPNSGCAKTPVIWAPGRKFSTGVKPLEMPLSNQSLAQVAELDGRWYSGKTIVRLNKGGTMDVTNFKPDGTSTTSLGVPWPANGVLYVKNNGACNGEIPTDADYDESVACGNVYVSGTYSKALTIAAANDVIIRPTIGAKLKNKSKDADIIKDADTDATLGLIANNFVRVGHRVTRTSGGGCGGNYSSTDEPLVTDVRIDAAIMSLQHSFIVDNYNCGRLGTLTVNGAIVQKYRGPVGQGSPIVDGFVKNYWYDDRLRYLSPPYFLDPVRAEWQTLNTQEQVPAR